VTAELITFLIGAVVAVLALGAWVVARVRAGDVRGGRRW
jgi:hypothetical protein